MIDYTSALLFSAVGSLFLCKYIYVYLNINLDLIIQNR